MASAITNARHRGSRPGRVRPLAMVIVAILAAALALAGTASARPTTTTAIAISTSQQTYGAGGALLTASVRAGSTPVTVGVVQFREGALVRAQVKLNSHGRASYRLPALLRVGKHTLTARYLTSAGYVGSSSSTTAVRVSRAPTTTGARMGSGLAVGVAVHARGFKAGGAVAVSVDRTVFATARVSATGQARVVLPAGITSGKHLVQASYRGSTTAAPSTFKIYVNVPKRSTSTAVRLSATTASVGTAVSARISVTAPGPAAGGTVGIRIDGRPWATRGLTSGSVLVSLPAFGTGKHTVTAIYNGDSRYTTSSGGSSVRITQVASSQCPASSRVCVDLTNDRAWIQSGGTVVYGPVPITSGRPGYRTSAGTFAVYWKDKDHRSSVFNDAPMPNSVFFDGGNAFHAGSLYVPSHGCIHLSWEASEYFFNNLDYGDVVTVFGYAPY